MGVERRRAGLSRGRRSLHNRPSGGSRIPAPGTVPNPVWLGPASVMARPAGRILGSAPAEGVVQGSPEGGLSVSKGRRACPVLGTGDGVSRPAEEEGSPCHTNIEQLQAAVRSCSLGPVCLQWIVSRGVAQSEARVVRDDEVAGSSPVTPTTFSKDDRTRSAAHGPRSQAPGPPIS